MICRPCQLAAAGFPGASHERCRGGTWCDCQHRPVRSQVGVVVPDGRKLPDDGR